MIYKRDGEMLKIIFFKLSDCDHILKKMGFRSMKTKPAVYILFGIGAGAAQAWAKAGGPSSQRQFLQAESGSGSCAWLETKGDGACVGAFAGEAGPAYAQLHRHVEECLWRGGASGCPDDAPHFCRTIPVPGKDGAAVCGPACAQDYLSLLPFLLPADDEESYKYLLTQSSPEATQERVLATLRVACDPRAILPLVDDGAVDTACRAADTRAKCAAAAGPDGLVLYDLDASMAPAPPSDTGSTPEAADGDEEDEEGDWMNYLEIADRAHETQRLTVEQIDESTACARDESAVCEWVVPLEGGDGVCLADVDGPGRDRVRALDQEVAVCMADNDGKPGTQDLMGCQAGHKFCNSVEISGEPGSFACVHADIIDPDVHDLWFYYYLACSGPVASGWEEFCSLARRSFYENLGCADCADVAEAAAPHQRLCATATTQLACEQLDTSIHTR